MRQSIRQSLRSMPEQQVSIAVVIPAYRVASFITDVITRVPSEVTHIIVVDDASPDDLQEVLQRIPDQRLIVLRHTTNHGVGGAMKTGFAKALELETEIIVKVDGDGQMDPATIDRLILPILHHQADYTKGARFFEIKALRHMPL